MTACKLMWCPKDRSELGRFMQEEFAPLLLKHFEDELKRTGEEHHINMPVFMAAWEMQNIALIVAYNTDGKATGFMPLYIYMPLFVSGKNITVERWQAADSETEAAMFEYLRTVAPVMGADRVYIASGEWKPAPTCVEVDGEKSFTMQRLKL